MAGASERSKLNDELVQKALKDDNFRKQLFSNPKATIEKEYGVKLPPDTQVHVHAENPHSLHVVLPFAPSAGAPLSASEVSGAADCSGWSSFALCTLECTQCGNNDTSCQPGPTGEE